MSSLFPLPFTRAAGTGVLALLLLLGLRAPETATAEALPLELKAYYYIDEFGNKYWLGGDRVLAYPKEMVPSGTKDAYAAHVVEVTESVPAYDREARMLPEAPAQEQMLHYGFVRRLNTPLTVGLPPAATLYIKTDVTFLPPDPDRDPDDPDPSVELIEDPPQPIDPDPMELPDYVPPDPQPNDPVDLTYTMPPPSAPFDVDFTLPTDPSLTETAAGNVGQNQQCGMARYWGDLFKATLHVSDRPLSYTPAFGPSANIFVSYESVPVGPPWNQPDAPVDASVTNLGPGWSLNWIRYIKDVPTDISTVKFGFGNGGISPAYKLTNYDYNRTLLRLPPNVPADLFEAGFPVLLYSRLLSKDLIARTGFNRYLHLLPDGGLEIYKGSASMDPQNRRLFLTDYYDRDGNRIKLEWVGSELRSITDAPGQITGRQFLLGHDALHRLSSVTDPLGRTATFSYAGGALASITDPVGVTSAFTYGDKHFINTLRTPYGDSKFTTLASNALQISLEMEDPMGGRELIKYLVYTGDGNPPPPANPSSYNEEFPMTYESKFVNTYYFNKRAMLRNGGPHDEDATIYHWLLDRDGRARIPVVSSIQLPHENRIFFRYPGQPSLASGLLLTNRAGTSTSPQRIFQAQVGEWTYEWNAAGQPTTMTEPGGFKTVLTYDAATGQELQKVERGTAAALFLVAKYTYAQHRPITFTGADGSTTSLTYNPRGQPATITSPDGSSITIAYGPAGAPGFGKPQSVTRTYGPNGARTVSQSFGYDAFDRIASITDVNDQYSIGIQYDAVTGNAAKSLDRITRITYPDGSFERVDYSLLDPVDFYDRLGRQTHYVRDALRRVQSVTDPLGRTVNYERLACCGSVDSLEDGNGHKTSWKFDVRERVLEKQIAGSIVATYQYDPGTGRLVSITDALNQVKRFTYTASGEVGGLEYLQAVHATPNVTFAYNDPLGRLTQMTDGTGLTQYAYWPIAGEGQTVLGGGRLKEITRPNAPDPETHTIHLDYDALGRVYRRSIGAGVANVEQLTFDMGRLTGVTNNLGTFTYTYQGNTDRLAAVAYPNGQQTTYGYGTAAQDFRLAQIKNLGVAAAGGAAAETLSQFDYTYDLAGRITTWAQRDSARPEGRAWTFGYDAADQLTSGSLKNLATNGILKTLGYTYDHAGNRTKTVENGVVDDVVANDFNQTFKGVDRGWIEIRGEVSERADVRIDGKPVEQIASLDNGSGTGAYRFRALVEANKGVNTYKLQGTELNAPPNSKIQTFNRTLQVEVSALGPSGYDANGNQLNNGRGQIYDWDAENRLIAIRYGGTNRKTVFGYDGLSRRVRTEEWDGGQFLEGHTSLWLGTAIAEERGFDNAVQRRYFDQGEQRVSGPNPGNYNYTTDHLGSIRELTDGAGVVRARYDYDPYGNRVKLSGAADAVLGFTGHEVHRPSGLTLTLHRVYDAYRGLWLSRDPIGEAAGVNLYVYVSGNPINKIDSSGLFDVDFADRFPNAAARIRSANERYSPAKRRALKANLPALPPSADPLTYDNYIADAFRSGKGPVIGAGKLPLDTRGECDRNGQITLNEYWLGQYEKGNLQNGDEWLDHVLEHEFKHNVSRKFGGRVPRDWPSNRQHFEEGNEYEKAVYGKKVIPELKPGVNE